MKRRTLAMLLALVMMFGLVACGGDKSTGSTDGKTPTSSTTDTTKPSTGNSGSASTEVKYKDELIFANAIDVTSVDRMENNTVIGWQIWQLMYDGLTKKDVETAEISLALAESYEMVSETEYVFKLKKGIKFHNGDELTSKDVVHTYERG